jgi:hypothetical protein
MAIITSLRKFLGLDPKTPNNPVHIYINIYKSERENYYATKMEVEEKGTNEISEEKTKTILKTIPKVSKMTHNSVEFINLEEFEKFKSFLSNIPQSLSDNYWSIEDINYYDFLNSLKKYYGVEKSIKSFKDFYE